MDTTSSYVIKFAAGQDSVPFAIQIMKDTFPEYPEQVLYVLSNAVNSSSIGADSSLLFVLIDTTPPAVISFLFDSMSAYEDADSFYQGIYIPFNQPFYVGIMVNNPNAFYVRYVADNLDCYRNGGFNFLNACGFTNFYFNGETCYAPPGISVYYKQGNTVNENMTSDKYFYCILRNIDANIITDSLCLFTIKHVNFFDTASLSFDINSIVVVNDSFASIGIPITISNPNRKPLYFHIDTTQSSSIYPGINYTFDNQEYGYGNGISHDTFWVNFINPHLTGDTIAMTFALRNDSVNSSPDTLLRITVIDTGSLFVSFLGAGLSHLKSDSIGYVGIYASAIAKYPISVRVSYLNGNAIRDTDFIFTDTTITFPPLTLDTISVPVIMLQDHLYSGNKQVNLQLTDLTPSDLQYGISQYTFTIIDDEDSNLFALGINMANNASNISIYPNPFENSISVRTALSDYLIFVTNSLGERVFEVYSKNANTDIDLSGLPSGLYLVTISDGEAKYSKKILKL
jgi:hypothetical protein